MALVVVCRRAVVALGLAWPVIGSATGAGAAVEIAVIPALSTRQILTTYQPLREHLEGRLGRPVALVTAPDYRAYIERTQRREYRYVITAPHFARLAQVEAGYRPLVRVKRELKALLVVRTDSGITGVAALRGKVVTTPDALAIITMLGLRLLHDHGLDPTRDVTVRSLASFNSAILAVVNGEAAAAVTAPTALNQMPEATRASVRTIAASPAVPPLMYLASPAVPAAEVEAVQRALLAFGAEPGGREFFKRTGFDGYAPLTTDELRALDPYVAGLKRQLATH